MQSHSTGSGPGQDMGTGVGIILFLFFTLQLFPFNISLMTTYIFHQLHDILLCGASVIYYPHLCL